MKAPAAPAISLLLAGSLCLLPFLIPYHQLPVLSFFPEWLAPALGTAAAFVMLAGRGAGPLPMPARWLIAFALFLAVRSAVGDQAYPLASLLAAVYVVYAVLVIWLGAQLATAFGVERLAIVIAAFLLAGALANSLAGMIQFYGRPALLEDLIAELYGKRSYGNIAQANLYANYLALGEGALLFLWLLGHVRTAYTLPALILLVLGSALSGSRSILLYALWYTALGLLAARVPDAREAHRLSLGAYLLAGASVAAYFAVPWFNDVFLLGPPGDGAFDRLLGFPAEPAEPRLGAWWIALRVLAGAPLTGVGMGGFAGAAFESGLDPSLTYFGEVWTSPHNLVLHLLAETGAVGTVLALGGLCVWGWQVARRYRADPQPALWWLIAAAGLQLVHSMVEFPLWSAHFLGVAALLVGASSALLETPSPAASRAGWITATAACAALALTLGITLRDYVRLDATRITGTTLTLAPAAQAQRDAATMRELTHGLMAPVAELWIVLGARLDRDDLAHKLAISERVARTWPANAVVVRHAVFLAFADKLPEAQSLLARALRTFPHRRDATILILEQALAADPTAIGPLLVIARSAPVRRPSLQK